MPIKFPKFDPDLTPAPLVSRPIYKPDLSESHNDGPSNGFHMDMTLSEMHYHPLHMKQWVLQDTPKYLKDVGANPESPYYQPVFTPTVPRESYDAPPPVPIRYGPRVQVNKYKYKYKDGEEPSKASDPLSQALSRAYGRLENDAKSDVCKDVDEHIFSCNPNNITEVALSRAHLSDARDMISEKSQADGSKQKSPQQTQLEAKRAEQQAKRERALAAKKSTKPALEEEEAGSSNKQPPKRDTCSITSQKEAGSSKKEPSKRDVGSITAQKEAEKGLSCDNLVSENNHVLSGHEAVSIAPESDNNELERQLVVAIRKSFDDDAAVELVKNQSSAQGAAQETSPALSTDSIATEYDFSHCKLSKAPEGPPTCDGLRKASASELTTCIDQPVGRNRFNAFNEEMLKARKEDRAMAPIPDLHPLENEIDTYAATRQTDRGTTQIQMFKGKEIPAGLAAISFKDSSTRMIKLEFPGDKIHAIVSGVTTGSRRVTNDWIDCFKLVCPEFPEVSISEYFGPEGITEGLTLDIATANMTVYLQQNGQVDLFVEGTCFKGEPEARSAPEEQASKCSEVTPSAPADSETACPSSEKKRKRHAQDEDNADQPAKYSKIDHSDTTKKRKQRAEDEDNADQPAKRNKTSHNGTDESGIVTRKIPVSLKRKHESSKQETPIYAKNDLLKNGKSAKSVPKSTKAKAGSGEGDAVIHKKTQPAANKVTKSKAPKKKKPNFADAKKYNKSKLANEYIDSEAEKTSQGMGEKIAESDKTEAQIHEVSKESNNTAKVSAVKSNSDVNPLLKQATKGARKAKKAIGAKRAPPETTVDVREVDGAEHNAAVKATGTNKRKRSDNDEATASSNTEKGKKRARV